MKKEVYTLILNSLVPTNRTGALASGFKYYVNWSSVLPQKNGEVARKYDVQFSLKSRFTNAVISKNLSVEIDFGQTNVTESDGNSSRKIGIIYPSNVGVNYYHTSNISDNVDITISHPSNDMITVQFLNFDETKATDMLDYIIILDFIPLDLD